MHEIHSINIVIDSNNRQIEINNRIQGQINKLTETVNQILKTTKSSQIDTGHLYETLLSRNRMIMMELQNLKLGIALDKINVVSPNILDHADLDNVWMVEPTDTPIKDILSVIIKFPKVKLACRKITIFPVAHNNMMLRIVDNVVAECNGEANAIKICSTTPGATGRSCKAGKHSIFAWPL